MQGNDLAFMNAKRNAIAITLVVLAIGFLALMPLASADVGNYSVSSATDNTGTTPSNLGSYSLNLTKTSDNSKYTVNSNWPVGSGFDEGKYIEFRFSPNLQNTGVNKVEFTIEWSRNNTLTGAKIEVYRATDGAWQDYSIELPSATATDITQTINLTAFIKNGGDADTLNNVNNLKVRFLAYVSTTTATKTKFDFIKLTVEDAPMPDNTPPTTTISIGNPKYISGDNTYITSATPITLSAADNGSGVQYTEYRINNGSWNTYSTSFTISGTDGTYTIEYRSADNQNNIETTKSAVVILDNTPPTTTLTIGEPKIWDERFSWYWIKNNTLLTMSAVDDGVGVDYIIYKKYSYSSWLITHNNPKTTYMNDCGIFKYYAVDLLGNAEPQNKQALQDDRKPPTSWKVVRQPNIAEYWITSSTEFSLFAEDGNASAGIGVDKIFYRINGGDWIVYTGAFTINGEGFCTIEWFAVDKLGNTETIHYQEHYLDNTPPTSWKVVGQPNINEYLVSPNTQFTLLADDGEGVGVAEIWYRIDGGNWTLYTEPFTITEGGYHTLEWYAVDIFGNVEEIHWQEHYVENTPPTSWKEISDPVYVDYYEELGLVWVSREETFFSLYATDNMGDEYVSAIYYMLWEYNFESEEWEVFLNWTVYTEPFHIGDGDGLYWLWWYAVDIFGNAEEIHTQYHITDDTQPNVWKIEYPSYWNEEGGFWYISYLTIFTIYADDGEIGSGVAFIFYRIDSGDWIWYDAPFTLIGYSLGLHLIEYYAVDYLCSFEEPEIKWQWVYIEDTPPESWKVVGQPNINEYWITSNTQFELFATDSESGVSAIYYRIDDEPRWQTYTGPFTITEEGFHTLEWYAVDNFGNTEQIHYQEHFVDNSPPTTTKTIGTPNYNNGLWVKSTTPFTLTAIDFGSGVYNTYYRIWNKYWGSWTVYTSAFTLGIEDGIRYLEWYSVDNIGNIETTNNQTHYVDDSPPITTLTSDYTGTSFGEIHYFHVEGSEIGQYKKLATKAPDQSSVQVITKSLNVPSGTDVIFDDGTGLMEKWITPEMTKTTSLTGNWKFYIWGKTSGYNYRYIWGYVFVNVYKYSSSGQSTFLFRSVGDECINYYNYWYQFSWTKKVSEITLNIGDRLYFEIGVWVKKNAGAVSFTIGYDTSNRNSRVVFPVELTSSCVSSQTKFTLTATDAGSGVQYTQYRINGGSWNTYTTPFSLTDGTVQYTQYRINGGSWNTYTIPFFLTDGTETYTIEYRSVDNLGNTEAIKSLTVYMFIYMLDGWEEIRTFTNF